MIRFYKNLKKNNFGNRNRNFSNIILILFFIRKTKILTRMIEF